MPDVLDALPFRRGHFRLESGLHSEMWLELDALFAEPRAVAPLVAALAERLRPHAVSVVCGPLTGGAFLAQALAAALGVGFAYAEPRRSEGDSGLFRAAYALPPTLRARLRGVRVAVVDDVISAGSSVRAAISALEEAGAATAVVGTLLLLGDAAAAHLGARGIAVEALTRRAFTLWTPEDCPHCRQSLALEDPRCGPERG